MQQCSVMNAIFIHHRSINKLIIAMIVIYVLSKDCIIVFGLGNALEKIIGYIFIYLLF